MKFMFNLDDYEDVAARVLRFQKAYPEGRIVTDVIQFNPEKGLILISAQIYRNSTDTLPAAVDYAFGDAATYNAGMRKWYVEDTSSSAIGRSLSLVLETAKKPTKQNMQRVNEQKVVKPVTEGHVDYWTTPFGEQGESIKQVPAPVTLDKAVDTVAEILGTAKVVPSCKHGDMEFKDGNKNGRAWGGYFCRHMGVGGSEPKCPTLWYQLSSAGTWEPQKARA
jgi:hypothetical protein